MSIIAVPSAKESSNINENLLDNWYFVGGGSQQGGGQFPINQRGSTSYTGTRIYTIDRWGLTSTSTGGSVSIQSDGVVLTRGASANLQFCQPIPLDMLIGKTITLSALVEITSGTVYLGMGETNNSLINQYSQFLSSGVTTSGLITITATISAKKAASSKMANVIITLNGNNGNNIKVKGIKLELGNTQTLAHKEGSTWVLNEIPNYGDQLLRCSTSHADSNDPYANNPSNITLTSAQYSSLSATQKAMDIVYTITDDETTTNFQPIITANGVLIGNGGGGISAKTLDTSSLTNDNNHIPTSGVVKSAIDALTPVDFVAASGTTKNVYMNGAYMGILMALGSNSTAHYAALISGYAHQSSRNTFVALDNASAATITFPTASSGELPIVSITNNASVTMRFVIYLMYGGITGIA